ncbi:MAG: hypothetical protein ACJ8CB_16025 [Ktedonobacteraceae bacterium]
MSTHPEIGDAGKIDDEGARRAMTRILGQQAPHIPDIFAQLLLRVVR